MQIHKQIWCDDHVSDKGVQMKANETSKHRLEHQQLNVDGPIKQTW